MYINYPSDKSAKEVAHQKSFSNRGMSLEKDINQSNTYYLDEDKAVIHKKHTPVTIVKVDYHARHKAKITAAYYAESSTTD